MEKRSVKRYRSGGTHYKKTEEKSNKYFFIKANIALGGVIVIMVASYLDTPFTQKVTSKVENTITYNTSVEEVKGNVLKAESIIKNRDGVSTFAQDISTDTVLDTEIIENINLNKAKYYDNQKK